LNHGELEEKPEKKDRTTKNTKNTKNTKKIQSKARDSENCGRFLALGCIGCWRSQVQQPNSLWLCFVVFVFFVVQSLLL